MRRFLHVFERLETTRKTSERVAALTDYFRDAPPADAAWTVYLLKGEKLRRLVRTGPMRAWVAEEAGLPLWLLEAAYAEAGDLAETLARLWPRNGAGLDLPLCELIEKHLLPLATLDAEAQRQALRHLWDRCTPTERLLVNKFITGGFRMGVGRGLTARSLAEVSGLEPALIEQRLMGEWKPTASSMQQLLQTDDSAPDDHRPYPFFLASPLQEPVESLGDPLAWQAEWKWDGIRAQLIHRNGNILLWSRGEEVITDRFPEIAAAAVTLPDGTVLDGELLAWRDEAPLPFGELQRRINRRNPGPKLLREVPVVFMVYDCLEIHGVDLRNMPLYARHAQALPIFGTEDTPLFRVSEPLRFRNWTELSALRERARELGVEGLMLKALDSPYRNGRKRGDWWKWKTDPYSLDAVMIYAQAGHGRRAGLYTDYTFALREGDGFVPFAKAYSGLTDVEIKEVDQFIRAHTLEKHGPVRVVEPGIVCEIAFEGAQASKRHKSGIAVRFPRIARLRPDKSPDDADTLDSLRALLDTPRGQ